jgi:excisionase family DNA binding protein
MKKFLTAPQIAKLEQVTNPTVTRWIREGLFQGARRVGREYRIPLESYQAWRESTKVVLSARTSDRSNVRSSDQP